jgi:hypothetical protein
VCLHGASAGFSREEALGKPVFELFEVPGTSMVSLVLRLSLGVLSCTCKDYDCVSWPEGPGNLFLGLTVVAPSMMVYSLPNQETAMAQYRGVVKKHTSFTLDLLRKLPDGSVFRYASNFR